MDIERLGKVGQVGVQPVAFVGRGLVGAKGLCQRARRLLGFEELLAALFDQDLTQEPAEVRDVRPQPCGAVLMVC